MSTVRVDVAPDVLRWARRVGFPEQVPKEFARIDEWIARDAKPTLKQLTALADKTGIPFGYFLRQQPPPWKLSINDFRDGFDGAAAEPSADLMAVIRQSQQRQEWYRDFAERTGLARVEVVGTAAEWSAEQTAQHMTDMLDVAVHKRTGTWNDTRKTLLRNFEALGGLTVATSMVDNNNHRMLDPAEFRGFCLMDDLAPLVFVNTNQTLNGQIFTLAHELAHVWRGTSGIGNEDPRREPQRKIEKWCSSVASLLLVPRFDLTKAWPQVSSQSLPQALDALARRYKCGTLVVLQALRRYGVAEFVDFDAAYAAEETRIKDLAKSGASGGTHYTNLPYRVGDRLSRALIADTLEGGTSYSEAMRLMSMKSAVTFDRYAKTLGVM